MERASIMNIDQSNVLLSGVIQQSLGLIGYERIKAFQCCSR